MRNRELQKRKEKRHKTERERMHNRLLDRTKSGFTLMPFNKTAVGDAVSYGVGVPRLGLGKVAESGRPGRPELLAKKRPLSRRRRLSAELQNVRENAAAPRE